MSEVTLWKFNIGVKNIMNMFIPHPLANLWKLPVERSLMKVWEVGKLAVLTDSVPVRTHTGEKAYKSRSSVESSQWVFKLAIYVTREKPDINKACETVLAHILLKIHENSQQKKTYKDKLCRKAFTNYSNLIVCASHIGEVPKKYKKCGSIYTSLNFTLKFN